MEPMLLIIDNYDSFTFNLVQYFGELGVDMRVECNDAVSPDDVLRLAPGALCISPGPGTPDMSGNTPRILAACLGRIPVLGVCLGHQAIAQHFGARVVRAPKPVHGKVSQARHDGTGLFDGLPSPLEVCRYHSLAVERQSLPACLRVTAASQDDVIMGLEHSELPVWGVQFHPEAILTQHGRDLLANFLRLARLQ